MLSRRSILRGLGAAALAATPVSRAGAADITPVDLRGSIDAAAAGLLPGAEDDQSRRFARMLKQAAGANRPLFLPPGNYRISNIDLPDNARIIGVPGASRIVYTGNGHLFAANGAAHVSLTGIVIDGANRWLGDYAGALVHLRSVGDVVIEDCEIAGSRKNAVLLERCGGRIGRSRLTGAGDAAIHAIESSGLSITGNTVADCGNGGILVHRWTKGEDNTMVSGNRISHIAAKNGGTGQNGNGINIFRADGVMVCGNHVSDCAFSAIRSNAGSNVQIVQNQCLRSGETAIYSEFGFEGAIVSANMIDDAANGILIVNFNEGGRLASVAGNVIRNLKTTGPYAHDGAGFGFGIAVEADTSVTGNVIENAPKWGMSLGWGPYLRNIVATGNIVRQAPVGIAVSVVEGAGTALISDNILQETPDGGVVGFRWNDRATDELALSGANGFSHLTVERNRL
ncbi:TIGR03808 family TAT-translocated repetitive protein [Rhizobium sp. YJ-22]|uniref:TIGR03808 family TAT-translocated repetitive protein n=1 Tax=Rhizobium sp. YJ-22 TaxID=3037556 RepID=UPI002412DA1F|nr:TIGR03808 family TAT-translocated repetitive protein [Rhizobium sp. YJ-22]MDG3574926.1 TIGR03808 family TAT-translocated repetitive protein [Rhizobium sp. YJ-22]